MGWLGADNNHRSIVGVGDIEHSARLFFQYVRIQALRVQETYAFLNRLPLGGQLSERSSALRQLLADAQPRQYAPIALDGVINEVAEYARADRWYDRMTKALLKVDGVNHARTESQSIPRRQQKKHRRGDVSPAGAETNNIYAATAVPAFNAARPR